MNTALLLVASLVIIVIASEGFTNAVEWGGYRLKLGSGATGNLLAALGTSLPETIVPVVAIIAGAADSQQIAVGAILGAPLMLLTVSTAITGLTVLTRSNNPHINLNPQQITLDFSTFLPALGLVLLCVLLPAGMRYLAAILLVLWYGRYVLKTLQKSNGSKSEMPTPLHLLRWQKDNPHSLGVIFQLIVSVGALIFAADLFVKALEQIASHLNIAPLILALILVPLATELPETLNSVLWVRSKNDELAIGNIFGSTVFQACLLGAIGIAFTDWRPSTAGLASAPATLVSAVYIWAILRKSQRHGGWLVVTLLPWLSYVTITLLVASHG